jgi:hypothetical protein
MRAGSPLPQSDSENPLNQIPRKIIMPAKAGGFCADG